MANATGIRRSDEAVRAKHGLAEVSDGLVCGRERNEQLLPDIFADEQQEVAARPQDPAEEGDFQA